MLSTFYQLVIIIIINILAITLNIKDTHNKSNNADRDSEYNKMIIMY